MPDNMIPLRQRRWLWPAIAIVAALVPFARGLSLSKIFFVRDLSLFFWPRHLWIRDTLRSGHFPLWDPYAAAGQPVFPDALNQLFLLPVLLLRALLPAVLGFNLIVALPFPIAALGAWLFLRRRVSPSSSTLGAIVFAASGSVLSTGNFPNLSWSVAFIPWTLWALDRDLASPSLRNMGLLAVTIALQILAGEPVSMMGTLAVVGAYALVFASDVPSTRSIARVTVRVAAAVTLAVLISSVQMVPMALAARQSQRGLMETEDFWSLHPLWVVESVLPHIFGDTFKAYNRDLPWIQPLNSNREPFFFSIYLGPVVTLLAFLGTLAGDRRWRWFWAAVALGGVIFGLGEYMPIYPAIQAVVPGLRSFRFPAKFFVFTSLAVAMLAANAAEMLRSVHAVEEGSAPPHGGALKATVAAGIAAAAVLGLAIALVLFAPMTAGRGIIRLGAAVKVIDPYAGAEYLFATLPIVGGRTLLLLLVSAVLAYVGWSRRREGPAARRLLFAMTVIDLLLVNTGLNPVLDASRFAAPSWTEPLRAHPESRFYFGGKFRGTLWGSDPDLAFAKYAPAPGLSVIEGRSVISAYTAMSPAAWRVREMLSYDLPQLWPVEHWWTAQLFHAAGRPERQRFLARSGVRYCLTGTPPIAGETPIRIIEEPFAAVPLFDCLPGATRAFVASDAQVIGTREEGLKRLFDASFDGASTVMLLQAPPQASGGSAPTSSASSSSGDSDTSAASARIAEDGDRHVVVDASVPEGGGYLVLLDSYDPAWRVDVDGAAAPLLRANVLFRAVHLAPGTHRVTFSYVPTLLYGCAAVSLISALAALAMIAGRH